MTRRRIFSLFLAMMLMFSFASTASATEVTTPATEVANKARTTYGISGYSSTSWDGYYQIQADSSGTLSGYIYANAACVAYLFIYDSSKTLLGVTTCNVTSAGGYNFRTTPSTLSAGTYYFGYSFDRNGVGYNLKLYVP